MSKTKTTDNNREFGQRLRQLRIEQNMTQTELADKARVSRSSVANWESGIRFPDVDAIKIIAALFNVPMDYLYGMNDNRYRINIPDNLNFDLAKLSEEGLKRICDYYEVMLARFPRPEKNLP